MSTIKIAAITISFLRKSVSKIDRTAWVKWREIIQSINDDKIDKGEIKHLINVGVGQARKIKTDEELITMLEKVDANELKETQKYVALYIELEKQARDAITYQKHFEKLELISSKLQLPILESLNPTIQNWIEQQQEDRFTLKIKLPGTVQIILIDYILRWILLGLYNDGIFKELNFFGDEQGSFFILNVILIPIIVFLYAFIRDKYINKKTLQLFNEIKYDNLKLKTHHSPWNYLLGFLFVISGSIIPIINFGGENGEGIWILELVIGLVYSIYIMVILKIFSKTTPTVPQIFSQLEELELKQVKSELTAEENDEEIVELEVNLRSANEKMDAYVLEAALFGALAFSAFLQVVASEVLSLDNIGLFSDQAFNFFKKIVKFDLSGVNELFTFILSKEGLMSLMAYETLFCSVFFLAVIASRLKFNDLTDSIDRSLNLSKTYNDKEENLINNNEDKKLVGVFTKKIRSFLSKGNLTLEQTKPIMEYMRFFRTLGISSFFAIIVTGGLFISVKLSFILLFISLLSLLFFKLDSIVQGVKNLTTQIQEYYFTVGKTFHLICWGLVIISLVFRSFDLTANTFIWGNILPFIAFVLLFFHYLISLFIPEHLEGADIEDDIYGSANNIQIFGKKILKVSLAFFFLGYMFKLQHWPGAGVLLILGSFSMIFHFLLSKKLKSNSKRLVSIVISISLAFAIGGIIWKIQHWFGANIMRWLALTGLFVSAIMVWKLKSEILPSTKRAVIILFVVGFIAQIPFMSWSLSRLSFNYSRFELAVEYDNTLDKMLFNVNEGGFADAENGPELDSLRYYCKVYTKKYLVSPRTQWDDLNWVAWELLMKTNDHFALEQAKIWVEKSIEMEEMGANVDTYAHILYKLGNFNDSYQQIKRAKVLYGGELPKETQELETKVLFKINNKANE